MSRRSLSSPRLNQPHQLPIVHRVELLANQLIVGCRLPHLIDAPLWHLAVSSGTWTRLDPDDQIRAIGRITPPLGLIGPGLPQLLAATGPINLTPLFIRPGRDYEV